MKIKKLLAVIIVFITINGYAQNDKLIKFIEKTPTKQLANAVLNTNFKAIENE